MDLPYEKRREKNVKIVIQKNFFSSDDWLGELKKIFADGVMIKKGNTTEVVRANHNHRQILIKKYKYKNFWHSLRHSGRQNRAIKCWHSALKFKEYGIPTPLPLGHISEYKHGLFYGAYLITEYVESQFLYQYFDTPHEKERLIETAQHVKNIFALFDKHYIVHGDCKCTNILIHNHKPMLIDLDSTKFYGYIGFQRRKHKDRKRFRHEVSRFPSLQEFFSEML
ncbi:lipopolysaccharide kinase InaA family protein [Candidatus Uabimicrobium amorphum]|uniref:Serine/threonine protein kinase n=1 Tax=Uabimicrobium amorphum TaxID=2596890 RepID=A0A5S9F0V4_UABAM|nr:lipopolysaccharide kinase InaA family protein [Candidatus Uabimicrobium amorphum]BBM81752.1 serine/threonine protein kinase [Candidatus Uabimicrobium amorphum]